jgi:trans-2,3-dihydro-3-hydroxyanthranilate isomerase
MTLIVSKERSKIVPNYNFLQFDVFTDRSFCGNPLAVFPEADEIDSDVMMKIAREMNLSETVFVLKSKSDDVLRHLRIFTPMREIPFAGHPIVGTWTCLAQEGVVPLPDGGNGWQRIFHEVGIGVLPVDIEFKDGRPVQVVMTQGKFEILNEVEDAHEQAEVARALGLAREDLDESLPIQVITTGLSCLAVPIRSLADLRDCHVNTSLLADIYTRLGGTGCHAFTRETLEVGASRAHARFFAPADNIPEDPATGSACGALGGYLVHHGALSLEPEDGRYKFVIEQGDFIHRPSRINLNVKGEAGRVEEVKVGGPAVLVARGEVVI